MPTKKIAISIDEHVLESLDHLVQEGRFQNRSRAVEPALRETVGRADRSRLVAELSKIDPKEVQDLADESLNTDVDEWPAY
jgi:Arc/MetJ-type ribon-helix-helix transcriptional regulator